MMSCTEIEGPVQARKIFTIGTFSRKLFICDSTCLQKCVTPNTPFSANLPAALHGIVTCKWQKYDPLEDYNASFNLHNWPRKLSSFDTSWRISKINSSVLENVVTAKQKNCCTWDSMIKLQLATKEAHGKCHYSNQLKPTTHKKMF